MAQILRIMLRAIVIFSRLVFPAAHGCGDVELVQVEC